MGTTGEGTKCQQHFPVTVILKNGLTYFQTPGERVWNNESCPPLPAIGYLLQES